MHLQVGEDLHGVVRDGKVILVPVSLPGGTVSASGSPAAGSGRHPLSGGPRQQGRVIKYPIAEAARKLREERIIKYPIAEAARKLRDHPYRTEAENIIEVATGRKPTGVESITTLLVADWLREFVAAYASGCTGLASDPDGPTLVGADPVTSGAAVLADATDEEVDGFLGAVRDRPEPDAPDAAEVLRKFAPPATWREARGAVPRGDGPRAEEVIRRLREQTEPGA